MNNFQVENPQQTENNGRIYSLSEPLDVGFSWGLQAVAWGGFIFSLWLFAQLFQENEFSLYSSLGFTATLFSIVSIVGIYKFSQRIRADNQSIAVKSWLGNREVKWEEIEQIRLRQYLADMAIYGNRKKLVMTSPSNWRGQDKQELLKFLNAQIEARWIELLDTNF